MTERLREVDVVVIGVGMVGSIVAKELAAAGYKAATLMTSPLAERRAASDQDHYLLEFFQLAQSADIT
jgi:choline dehydrogenase-like flavoprotein